MENNYVLAIGAHPDDIEISCGGTIAYLSSLNYKVVCVFVTNGEVGGDPEVRIKESKKACEILETHEVKFLGFKDTMIKVDTDLITTLEQLKKSYNPIICLIPSEHDTHQDHRNLYHCCISAFRKVPTLLSYESPSTTQGFFPNTFFKINDFVGLKKQAIESHVSQKERDYMEWKAMQNLSSYRGTQCDEEYAEAYQCVKINFSNLVHK